MKIAFSKMVKSPPTARMYQVVDAMLRDGYQDPPKEETFEAYSKWLSSNLRRPSSTFENHVDEDWAAEMPDVWCDVWCNFY